MPKSKRPFARFITSVLIASASSVGIGACAPSGGASEAGSLADLVVSDPDFTFATARSVRLELQVSQDAPELVEVTDAEGRRLMQGAFLNDTAVDLKLPVGRASTLEVRSGRGAQVRTQTVEVDASGRAATDLR